MDRLLNLSRADRALTINLNVNYSGFLKLDHFRVGDRVLGFVVYKPRVAVGVIGNAASVNLVERSRILGMDIVNESTDRVGVYITSPPFQHSLSTGGAD